MPLSVRSRLCENVFVLHCQGRIVAGDEVHVLEKALEEAAREVPRIVLEVHDVDRLDSLGIGLLVRYAARLRKRGGDIRLADAPPFILSLLKLTMLTALLQVCPTEQEALLSFARNPSAQSVAGKGTGKVLVLDQSADLCAFVKTVLSQHGLEVRTAGLVRDAKVLLQVDRVDYILTSADSPQLCSDNVIDSLKIFAPSASILILPGDFKHRDALDATATLLHMFGLQPNPA
jgi:anti-sigma B factor antagonist